MPAYNFHKRFMYPIFSGSKSQTIRRRGRRRHAEPGDDVQLYFAQRTQHCRKVRPDAKCLEVLPVTFDVGLMGFRSIKVGDQFVDPCDRFAMSDGFDSIDSMHAYWLECRGDGVFDDYLMIKWTPPELTGLPTIQVLRPAFNRAYYQAYDSRALAKAKRIRARRKAKKEAASVS